MKKQIYLQGYFTEYDKYDRAKIMFLDDYNDLNESVKNKQTSFSKSYLKNLCSSIPGNNPLSDDQKYFFINCKKQKIGFIDGKMVPLLQLRQHIIKIEILISKYNFKKIGKRINGWNIKPLKISLIEM